MCHMLHNYLVGQALLLISGDMMMIAMMIILMCVRVSVLSMTTNAAFLRSHQIEAFQELGCDQKVLSIGPSRKLMLKKMDEWYGDQDLEFYKDKEKALYVGESLNKGPDVTVIEAQRSDPTKFTGMDYSYVRRRLPIHNKSSPKPTNSP